MDSAKGSSKEDRMDQELETIELNLGEFLVTQLEEKIGDPSLIYPRGFQALVQVPISLARQLYAFYIESIYQQMDAQDMIMEQLVKEDEEFARTLEEDEEKVHPEEPQHPLEKAIRQMRRRNTTKKRVIKAKDLNPDKVVTKMKQEKLIRAFPLAGRNIIVQLLHAHNNDYEDTVEIMLTNTEEQNINGDIDSIKKPPLSDEILDEMEEVYENCKDPGMNKKTPSGRDYREEANHHLKMQRDLYQKAKKYQRIGLKEVARFYSDLASQQTRYCDWANSKAATTFLDEHSKRLKKLNTLDIHFLYVKEALISLDIFLDEKISLLRESLTKSKDYPMVITGRGRNSRQGRSVLRPAVQNHLKTRGLEIVQLNTGMIKIKVTKASKLTNETEKSIST